MIDWELAEKLWNQPKEIDMVKRTYNVEETEPEQTSFNIPSEKEHLLQVVDFVDQDDPDVILVKIEVVGGDENGRSLLNRCTLDQEAKGFFFTRMFLKAIGEPYKGVFEIESDRWIGRQFYGRVAHTASKGKTYANIGEYNFDKVIEQYKAPVGQPAKPEDIAWEN